MDEVARLAVVVCTYNRSHSLMQTLESLYASGYEGSEYVDIVVVANHCSDDTLARLHEFRLSHRQEILRLRWLEEPLPGKSHALNTAIKAAHNPALCFIDDDQVVEKGFLIELLQGLDRYPEDDIFCGRIWPAWDGSEPRWVHAKEPYAIPIRPFPEFDLGQTSIGLAPSDRYPSGGNITVRRRVFEKIGGFSTELGPTGHNLAGGEDHDFLHRAVTDGFRIRYLPGVSQLHAVDPERTRMGYTLRKSLLRSRSSYLIQRHSIGPRLYMLRKIIGHAGRAAFTLNPDRRFFYLVRLTASIGELGGAIETLRQNAAGFRSRVRNGGLPNEYPIAVVMALIGLAAVVIAASTNTRGFLSGLVPVISTAMVATGLILLKSIRDFTQTGPRIQREILSHYRRYTLFAVCRLVLWAFAIMTLTGSWGAIAYYMLNVAMGWTWSPELAALAALLGILGAAGLQFVRKLRFNPGLLMASMQYRASRLHSLWRWATPERIGLLQNVLITIAASLVVVASWGLATQERPDELLALWAAVLFYVGVAIWAGWLPEAQASRRRAARPEQAAPNIVMIGSDTLRADRISALGYRRTLTPTIDMLGSRGTLFANCYVPCARTAPSLISLLTGTWPHTHGVRDNFVTDEDTHLNVSSLPQLLKPLGYRTAAISDWCGADMEKFSLGFDHADLPKDQWNLKYLIRQGPKDIRLFLSMFTNNRLGRLLLPEVYYLGGVPLTSQMGRRARNLVSRLGKDDAPFFLNVFYSTTHPPFASEWPWYTRYADPAYAGESKFAMARLTDPFEILRRQGAPREEFDLDQIIDLYDGCVAQFDDEVGKMLRHLEACGLADNTIVVVYSDHGMEFFEHETWGQGNSAVGDFSPRIPLLIHDPRKPGKGVVKNVVRSIDVAPTLLELVGSRPPASMEGVSLTGYLTDSQQCPELNAFNETGIWIADIPGLPENHLKYPDLFELLEVPNRDSGTLAIKPQYAEITLRAKDRMIRNDRWKLVYQPLSSGYLLRLFDCNTDPGCTKDLSASYPKVVAALWAHLESWMASDPAANLSPDRTGTMGSSRPHPAPEV